MSDEEVQVKFGAETQGVAAGAERVKAQLSEVGQAIEQAEHLFRYLGERMIEVFALHEIKDFVAKMSEVGEQIERISSMTGLSTEAVQTIGFALQRTGGNAEMAGLMITRLERNIEAAAAGSGQAYDAFKKLGVTLDELQHDSIDRLIERIAVGFKNIPDPVERAAVAAQVGSRGFAQLLPALLANADGLRIFHEKLKELGDDLSENTVTALAETHGRLVDLGKAAEGAGVQGMLTFKGAIDGVIEDFTYAIVDIGKFIGYLRDLQVVAGVDVVEAFGYLAKEVARITAELEYYAQVVTIKWEEAARLIKDTVTRNWDDIATAQTVAQAKVDQAARNLIAGLQIADDKYKDLAHAAKTAAQAMLEADKAATHAEGNAARGDRSKANKGDLSDIATESAVAKANLATQIAILQQEAAYHRITKQQEIEQEKQAVDAEVAIDRHALQEKLALYAKGSDEYRKTLNQMQVLEAQHVAKIAQLDVKMAQANQHAAQQTYQSWMHALQPIQTAFDGMLNGVLNGTQTLTQAMANMFANMAVSVIESILKIIAEWLVFELVTEGQGSWDDFVAIQGGGGGGPLGTFGSILGFADGTPQVTRTGLAMIHQNEMIIPAAPAQAIRDGAGFGGGGPTHVTINLQAIDARSGASFLKSNGDTIAQLVAGKFRNQNAALSRTMKNA